MSVTAANPLHVSIALNCNCAAVSAAKAYITITKATVIAPTLVTPAVVISRLADAHPAYWGVDRELCKGH